MPGVNFFIDTNILLFSYYDAQIIAAAKQLGCSTVYSEDFNDGQDYGGVRVINPFREIAKQ